MGRPSASVNPTRNAMVWIALVVVYVVWGSTYLAIRVGVHPTHGSALPPLLLAGVRFSLAGALLLALSVRRPAADGHPDPLGRRQWWSATVVGLALLLGGNGLVSIAEQRIPSGIAALVVATVPIWAALLGAVSGQERVTRRHALGLLLGLAGVGVLVVGAGGGRTDAIGVVTVLLAALLWAAGSVWSRQATLPRRPLVSTGMQMVGGGAGCLLAGLLRGEASDVHLATVSAGTWWAVGYLVLAGSMLAYTAYVWLLQNAELSLVTTYAYVNPLVAVLLGTLILDEPFTTRTVVAGATIIVGVVLIVRRRARPDPAPAVGAGPGPVTDAEQSREEASCR